MLLTRPHNKKDCQPALNIEFVETNVILTLMSLLISMEVYNEKANHKKQFCRMDLGSCKIKDILHTARRLRPCRKNHDCAISFSISD